MYSALSSQTTSSSSSSEHKSRLMQQEEYSWSSSMIGAFIIICSIIIIIITTKYCVAACIVIFIVYRIYNLFFFLLSTRFFDDYLVLHYWKRTNTISIAYLASLPPAVFSFSVGRGLLTRVTMGTRWFHPFLSKNVAESIVTLWLKREKGTKSHSPACYCFGCCYWLVITSIVAPYICWLVAGGLDEADVRSFAVPQARSDRSRPTHLLVLLPPDRFAIVVTVREFRNVNCLYYLGSFCR